MRKPGKGDKLSGVFESSGFWHAAMTFRPSYPVKTMESADLFVTEYLATFIGERETAALRREAVVLITSTVLTLQQTFAEVEVEVVDYHGAGLTPQGRAERRVVIRDLGKQVILRSDDERMLESVSQALKAQLSAQILSLNYVAKARQAKREWEVSADLLQDEIFLLDHNLRVHRLNQAAAARMGATPQSLVGKPFAPELAGGLDVLRAAFPQTLLAPSEFILQIDKAFFHIRIFLVNWGYERNGYILIRNECTADVIGQRTQLRGARMAGLGQVSVGLAHEINNPLGVILAAANSLQRRHKDDQHIQSLAGIIEAEVERCRRITHALLDYGRAPERQGSLQNISNLLQHLPDRIQATHPGAVLSIMAHPNLFVVGHEDDLMRLFTNLTANAVEASAAKSPVTISLLAENRQALVSVANEGPEIPREEVAKLFQPFYTTKATGTGLGLSFALKIVELMQGQIGYSHIGGQNVFQVRLPLAVAI